MNGALYLGDTYTPDELHEFLRQEERLWLFLDYDGTLSEFAPTPDQVIPDEELIALLAKLAEEERVRLTIISGRRLDQIETLIPLQGILLAGTYGIEMRTPDGEYVDRIPYERIRPSLEVLEPLWAHLIAGREGFFLEDKDWALALHARFAEAEEAEIVLAEARKMAEEVAATAPGRFRILGGHRFLELGPLLAHKGRTVEHLLELYPLPDALLLYIGDDDKDEEAFEVIQAHGGMAIVVSDGDRESCANCRLRTPGAVRRWLKGLMSEVVEDMAEDG